MLITVIQEFSYKNSTIWSISQDELKYLTQYLKSKCEKALCIKGFLLLNFAKQWVLIVCLCFAKFFGHRKMFYNKYENNLSRDTLPLAMRCAEPYASELTTAFGLRPNPIQSRALKRCSNPLPAPINKKP